VRKTGRDQKEQRVLDDVLALADLGVLEASEGDREDTAGEAHAGRDDRLAMKVCLIDDDGDPSTGVAAEGESYEERGHGGAVEGTVTEEAVEPLGAGFLVFVEREGA